MGKKIEISTSEEQARLSSSETKKKAKWKQWRYNVYTGQMLLKMEEDHKEDLWIE